ncbi:MAG: hypothetical protein ABR583_07900 [Gaiellaceae bacterium]
MPGAARPSDLAVASLDGRLLPVIRLAERSSLVDFDFDGRRIAWAADAITRRRIECPSPGVGAPCQTLVSGVTTVWVAEVGSRARPVARLRFTDVYLDRS